MPWTQDTPNHFVGRMFSTATRGHGIGLRALPAEQGDTVTAPIAPQHSSENVVRGGMLALIVIPVGVVVWVLIWSIGVVASIVAYGIAFAAVWLYRRGSGGIVTRAGAWTVTAVVVVTLLLGFWLGLAVNYAGGLKHLDYFNNPQFWTLFQTNFGALVQQNLVGLLLAIAIGAAGTIRVLGRAFATARATSTTTATFGTAPTIIPPTTAQLNPDSTGTISSAPDDRTPPPTQRD